MFTLVFAVKDCNKALLPGLQTFSVILSTCPTGLFCSSLVSPFLVSPSITSSPTGIIIEQKALPVGVPWEVKTDLGYSLEGTLEEPQAKALS